jgi:hemolysin-activating ACP:hemolysin acyltransferase
MQQAPVLSADDQRKTEALTAAAAALGEVMSLMVRSPEHAGYGIPDVEWLLVPAIYTRQYVVVRAPVPTETIALPGAAILWASVSPEIDAQYRGTPGIRLKLDPAQRTSGPHLWLTDLIGNRRLINEALNQLRPSVFGGRQISFFNMENPSQPAIVDLMPA